MATMTFASKLQADGSFTIPQEAVETLGLHPGDEIQVSVETPHDMLPNQVELQRRAALLFEDADQLNREPSRPLTDPLEAAWAQGADEKARKMGLTL